LSSRDIPVTRLWYLTWQEAVFQVAAAPLRVLGALLGGREEGDG
jgi:hypothetical protein